MAQEYYFFDSTKDDIRRFQARHLAEVIDTILQTGLLHKDGTPTIRVTANTKDMKVRVTPGKAVIKGHLYRNTETMALDIPKTDTVKRVVLRLDNNIDNRFIKVFVTEGDAMTPKPLVREGDVYELALCHIKYDASKGYLEHSDITDTRFDENLCGLAHSLITVPTSEYQKEWNEFVQRYEKWFQQHQNSSYATLDYVKKNDDELRRLIAEIQLGGGGGGVIEGLSFATDFNNFQNISIKAGQQRVEVVSSRSVTLDKSISGLASGDGVTLYDGTNQEQLTVASVSGLTVNFTTTITKTFKPGAYLARSMGVLESGKNQYSFGGWGDTKELVDYDYTTEKLTLSNYSRAPRIENACVDKNFMYIGFKTYNSNNSGYVKGYVVVDMLARKVVSKDFFPGKTGASNFMYGVDGTMIFLTNEYDGKATIVTFKNGLPIKTVELKNDRGTDSLVRALVEVERKEGMFSARYVNGTQDFYRVDAQGNLTVVATMVNAADKGIATEMMYLKGNYYLSRPERIFRLEGDAFVKHKELYRPSNDDPQLDIFVLTDAWGDETLLSIVNSNYSSSKAVAMQMDKAIETGGKMNYVDDKDFGFLRVRYPVKTNSEVAPLVFYNSHEKNPRGVGLVLVNNFGSISGVRTDLDNKKLDNGEIKTIAYRQGEKVDFKGGIDKFPIVMIESDGNYGVTFNIQLSFVIGSGKDLTSNDIRFKLPNKSNGISATVTASPGISVKARFGNVELSGVEKNGQTQFAGMSSAMQDELTLTMKRLTTSNTGSLKRLAGGIDA